jgi:hypothetical protein
VKEGRRGHGRSAAVERRIGGGGKAVGVTTIRLGGT